MHEQPEPTPIAPIPVAFARVTPVSSPMLAPPVVYRSTARRRVMLSAVVLGVLIVSAVGAPWLAPYNPFVQPDIVALKSLPPSWAHPFGTDTYSRDVLSRVMYGARVSLSIATVATIVSMVFGTAYGAIAGYAGGWIDTAMMRIVDVLLAIPRVLVLIAIAALWQTLPLSVLTLIIGVTGWLGVSRLVRGQVRSLSSREFIVAARALGANHQRVIIRHVLPNVLHTVVVAATLGIGQVIVLEAGLSYLGLGVQPPGASWGNIIQDGADQMNTLWWISVFPGLMIVITVIACNALGEAMTELFNRRTTVKIS